MEDEVLLDAGKITVKAGQQSDWKLQNGVGDRQWSKLIRFEKKFSEAPYVCVFFSTQDTLTNSNHRVNVMAEDITKDGFRLTIVTWEESCAYCMGVSWIAIDKSLSRRDDGKLIQCGRTAASPRAVSGFSLQKGNGNRSCTVSVPFGKKFSNSPVIFAALSMLDTDWRQNSRISISTAHVKKTGFDLTFSTWGDSVVNGCSVSWIAFDRNYLEGTNGFLVQCGSQRWSSKETPEYALHNGVESRYCAKDVAFDKKFLEAPTVLACIAEEDVVSRERDYRIAVSAENITTQGIRVQGSTWRDSQVFSVAVAWIAFGKGIYATELKDSKTEYRLMPVKLPNFFARNANSNDAKKVTQTSEGKKRDSAAENNVKDSDYTQNSNTMYGVMPSKPTPPTQQATVQSNSTELQAWLTTHSLAEIHLVLTDKFGVNSLQDLDILKGIPNEELQHVPFVMQQKIKQAIKLWQTKPEEHALQPTEPSIFHSTESKSAIDRMVLNQNWSIVYKDIRMEKEIGKGAYGVVSKGKWKAIDVAVKTIITDRKDLKQTPTQELFAEAELMMKLRPHPNITQLLGICEVPPCIITEFVDNGSLKDWLEKYPVSHDQMVSIARGIAAGMWYLHSEGVIHRDLAARNILLDKTLTPKVSDFGMSRVVLDNKQSDKTCSDIGPIRWMAPEAMSERVYNKKTDVWSYGVVLYEIMTRKLPYGDIEMLHIGIHVLMGKLSLIPEIEKEQRLYPSVLVPVFKKCLQREPQDRPTFEDIVNDMTEKTGTNMLQQLQNLLKQRDMELAAVKQQNQALIKKVAELEVNKKMATQNKVNIKRRSTL